MLFSANAAASKYATVASTGVGLQRLQHLRRGRERHGLPVDGHRGRLLAAADAGRRNHAHVAALDAEQFGQPRQQVLGTGQFAGQAVAHAHGEARCRLVAAHHFEVVVEGRDLVDLGHGNVHFPRQRHQVAVVQAAEGVVELVQVLDEQVAPVALGRRRADQRAHFDERRFLGLAALELALAADALAHLVGGGERHDGVRAGRCLCCCLAGRGWVVVHCLGLFSMSRKCPNNA